LTHFQSVAFAGNLEFFGPTGVSIAFAGKLKIVIQSAAKDLLLRVRRQQIEGAPGSRRSLALTWSFSDPGAFLSFARPWRPLD